MYKFRYVQHVELLAESWICVSEQDKKTYEKFAVSVPFKLQHWHIPYTNYKSQTLI